MDKIDIALNTAPLRKNEETLRITILTNICRMMIRRKLMDFNKYSVSNDPNNGIDNDKFLEFIKAKVDSNVYKLPLDAAFVSETNNPNFIGNVLVVKIISQAVTDVTNNSAFNEFLSAFQQYHKLVVFYEASDKVFNTADKKHDLEIFDRDSLLIDHMAYPCAPLECSILKGNEHIQHIVNPMLPKILKNDPTAKYYNAKIGDILRIVRRSTNNGIEFCYRKVIEPKPVFK